MITSESRPKAADLAALAMLELAKLPRTTRRLSRRNGDEGFYETFFSELDRESYERDPRMTVRRDTILGALTKFASPGAKVLDIGCGLGDVLASLGEAYTLHGVDYSEANVRYVQHRLGARADVRQGSIYALPFESASLDVGICLEVIEHIEDDEAAVGEIARVIKPGGTLIASVPYTYYWPQYLRLIGHYRHYTRDSFTRLLLRHGLRVEAYLPNYPNWHRAYVYRYVLTRALAKVGSRALGLQASPYRFTPPFTQRPLIDRLADGLASLLDADRQLDYAKLPTSTFVVAQRDASAAPATQH